MHLKKCFMILNLTLDILVFTSICVSGYILSLLITAHIIISFPFRACVGTQQLG